MMKERHYLLMTCLIVMLLAIMQPTMALEPIKTVEGIRGKAAHIEGYTTYLEDTGRSDFAIENGMTVSLWLRPEDWGHQSVLLGNVGTFDLLKRGISGGNGFYFWERGSRRAGSLLWAPKAFPSPLGKWMHIAFSYDQKGHGVGYLNGKKAAEQLPGQEPKGQGIVKIKSKNPWKNKSFNICGSSFAGDVDEVYIYGRVLSEEEIANLAAGKAPAGALAAYLMDDENNPGKDYSGNERHLKQVEGTQGGHVPILGYELDLPAAATGNGVTAYCRSCVDRVFQKDRLKTVKVQDVPAAELAGNEYETFQLVVLPERQLDKVNISLPPFEYKGMKIPAELRQIGYVRIPKPSNIKTPKAGANVFGEMVSVYPGPEAAPGMYPDPLPKMEKDLVLKAGESRGFWVTVKSPANAPAGIYRSTAIISDSKGIVLRVPLSIKVRGFSLPDERHCTHITSVRTSISETRDIDKFYEIMHSFYLSPTLPKNGVNATFDEKGDIHLDTAKWDAEMEIAIGKYNQQLLFLPPIGLYGIPKGENATAKMFDVQVTKGDGHLTPEFAERFAKYLEAMSAHLKKKGYLSRTRITLVDEPHTPNDFSICWEVSRLVRKHAPEIKIQIEKWPTRESIGCADVWCLGAWQLGQMEAALKRGEKIEHYPNWHMLIDRPVMDRRMMGFLMWKHGVSGITHYALDSNWDNAVELRSPALRYPDGRTIYGSGLVMYPEKDRMPMPSMRIETIRDSLDDYEYIYMLDRLAETHSGKPEATEAKQYIKDACAKLVPCYESFGDGLKAGWKTLEWELDPHVLLKYRLGLMDRIEKLQSMK